MFFYSPSVVSKKTLRSPARSQRNSLQFVFSFLNKSSLCGSERITHHACSSLARTMLLDWLSWWNIHDQSRALIHSTAAQTSSLIQWDWAISTFQHHARVTADMAVATRLDLRLCISNSFNVNYFNYIKIIVNFLFCFVLKISIRGVQSSICYNIFSLSIPPSFSRHNRLWVLNTQPSYIYLVNLSSLLVGFFSSYFGLQVSKTIIMNIKRWLFGYS